MAYDQLIKMVTNFYSRESVRKIYEDEAARLEKFIEQTEKINAETNKDLNILRLNAQVRSLTGARKPNYYEFILFSQYFDVNSVFLDYPVLSRHRVCFKLVISSDRKRITRIIVNKDKVREVLDNNTKAIGYFILYIFFQVFLFNPVLEKWLLNTWHLPKVVVGIILGGIILFFITVILRIQFDNENLNDFVKKLNHKEKKEISTNLRFVDNLKSYYSSKYSK